MNALQTVQFNTTPITIIDHNGEGWMTGEDIGKALGYGDPRVAVHKIFDRNRDELEDYSTVVKLVTVDGKERETRVYNEEGMIIITFLSKQPKAVMFRRWTAGVLKRLRQGQQPALNPTNIAALQAELLKANPRLNDVLNLTRLGYSQERIGKMLQIGGSTVFRELIRLRDCGFVVCADSKRIAGGAQ